MANCTGHDTSSQGRRSYRPPSLVDYGTVAKLTQGSGGTASDGTTGMMAPACL